MLQSVKAMSKTISVFVLTCFCMSSGAVTVEEADDLYRGGHWTRAADAYENLLSTKKVHGGERWRTMLRAGIAREKNGNGKKALHWADQIVRGVKGRAFDDILGDAYLLKQRRIFAAKSSTAVRDKLVREVAGRLKGHRSHSAVCENEAVVCVKEKRYDAADRLLSDKNLILSPRGSNVVTVVAFSTLKNDKGISDVDKVVKAIFEINEKDHSLANSLADWAMRSVSGDARVVLLANVAEMAANSSEDARAKNLYEDAMSVKTGRELRQRQLLCYAEFLQTIGMHDRCAEIYAEWRNGIQQGDKYAEPMHRCISFLVATHRCAEAKLCIEKFCGDDSGVYSEREKKSISKQISSGLDGGFDDARNVDAWKAFADAETLLNRKSFGDAAKAYRSIAVGNHGQISETAQKRLGECYRRMGKYDMAAQVWDELAKKGDKSLKYDCLARKARMFLLDRRDTSAAKRVYLSMRELIDDKDANMNWRLRDLEVSTAMCDLAEGRVDDAEPVFKRERDSAAKARSLDFAKWASLIDACSTARMFSTAKTSALKDAVIADLLVAEERYADAETTCRDALKKPGLSRAHAAYVMMQRAKCLVRLKKFKNALETYREIQSRFSDCPCAARAMLRAGVLCAGHLNDPSAGSAFFRFIEEKWPDSPLSEQALFYRMTIAIWSRRWNEAEELQKRFVAKYPNSTRLPIATKEYAELIARRIPCLPETDAQNRR